MVIIVGYPKHDPGTRTEPFEPMWLSFKNEINSTKLLYKSFSIFFQQPSLFGKKKLFFYPNKIEINITNLVDMTEIIIERIIQSFNI